METLCTWVNLFSSRSHNDLVIEFSNLYITTWDCSLENSFLAKRGGKKGIHAGVNTALLSEEALSLVPVEYILDVLLRAFFEWQIHLFSHCQSTNCCLCSLTTVLSLICIILFLLMLSHAFVCVSWFAHYAALVRLICREITRELCCIIFWVRRSQSSSGWFDSPRNHFACCQRVKSSL